jgi:hypothetical protein
VTQVSVDANTAGAITVGMANNSLDVVYAGRARVRGVYLIHTSTAGTLPFRNGGATGTAMLTVPTPASANSTRDVVIPDEGIMFENGAYITYTAGTTVFSSFTALYN